MSTENWNEDRILDLILNKTQESSTLEFKRSDSLNLREDRHKKELSKDVAAFANSGGGTIIYCLVEKDHYASSIDSGLNPTEITKERIEQVINSNIHPRIIGLTITPVPLEISSPGNFGYVLSIPESSTAHQSEDRRYYKRFNFSSTPMEDHEIRDVMNRRKTSQLVPNFIFKLAENQDGKIHEYSLLVELENISSLRAREFKIEIEFPTKLITQKSHLFSTDALTMARDSGNYQLTTLKFYKSQEPIFPKESLIINVTNYQINDDFFGIRQLNPKLFWRIYVDDAQPSEGIFLIEKLHSF